MCVAATSRGPSPGGPAAGSGEGGGQPPRPRASPPLPGPPPRPGAPPRGGAGGEDLAAEDDARVDVGRRRLAQLGDGKRAIHRAHDLVGERGDAPGEEQARENDSRATHVPSVPPSASGSNARASGHADPPSEA